MGCLKETALFPCGIAAECSPVDGVAPDSVTDHPGPEPSFEKKETIRELVLLFCSRLCSAVAGT